MSTLAFDYPPRSKFFRGELEQFLLMAREEKLDPLVPLGSYAGAMGIPQFMPTSFRNCAVDGDGDGHRDLWGDWTDVFASVGNYLKAHGWRAGEPVMTAADVTGADLGGLVFGKIDLDETVGSLRARGVKFETSLPPKHRRRSWRSPFRSAPSIASASPISTRSLATTAATSTRAP